MIGYASDSGSRLRASEPSSAHDGLRAGEANAEETVEPMSTSGESESGSVGHRQLPLGRGELAFRLLVEAVEDYAIFLLSPEGHVLSWNLGAERIKGYTADEIIGEHFSRFYTPEERAARRPMRLLGRAAKQGRFEDQGWRVRKDGTRFWADVIVTALRDADGTPYAFAKITRDLTERRAAEQRERQLLAEQRARAAAEDALAARTRFLGIASHELKTPSASLLLTVESLLRAHRAQRLSSERLELGLSRIETAALRMGALVEELLDVSLLKADTLPFERKPIDLVSVTREVIDRFGEDHERHRVQLDAPSSSTVLGDASRLDQVVTNLLDNAMKYSEADAPIDIAIRDADDGLLLTVSDRGVGIDEETRGRLYEAFGRGANVEHIPGLGLGLYISHQIVERYGGRIEAHRRDDGPGSVFSVWLPRGDDG
jgi:PAS domain S-box-containing protein